MGRKKRPKSTGETVLSGPSVMASQIKDTAVVLRQKKSDC